MRSVNVIKYWYTVEICGVFSEMFEGFQKAVKRGNRSGLPISGIVDTRLGTARWSI